MNRRDRLPRFLKSFSVLIGVAVVCLSAAATTATAAGVYKYDLPTIARVDVHEFEAADASSAQLGSSRERSASPSVDAQGTSTTPSTRVVATEAVARDPAI